MAEQRDVENLHREASGFYLKGDLQSAQRVWREILTLRPQDVRAKEGVRLCDQFSDGVGSNDASAGPPEPAKPASVPSSPSSVIADDAGKGAGLWNWDEGAKGDQPPAAEPTSAAEQFGSTSIEPPPPEAESVPPAEQPEPSEDVGEAAEIELRRRANELLDGAQACLEAGEQDEALAMLERVLILDEENEAALSLKAKIEFEAEAAIEPEQAAVEPEGGLVEGIETNAAQAVPEAPSSTAAADPEAGPVVGEIDFDDVSDPDIPGGDEFGGEEVAPKSSPARKRFDLSAFTRLPDLTVFKGRGPWLYGAVGVVLIAVVAFVVLPMIASDAPVLTVEVRPEMAAPEPDAAVPDQPAGVPDGTAVEPTEDGSADERFVALLADARAAMDRGEFEVAVVACNSALEIRPGHPQVAAMMREAAASYREQAELETKWRVAREEFEAGNYREALRLFYRLPEDQEPERVKRYLFNGWYNLGVMELRGWHCEQALEALDEARTIDPDVPDLLAAFDLAMECGNVRSTTFPQDVNGLPILTLED